MAADLFCREFIKAVEQGDLVKEAFIKINEAIDLLNKKYVPRVDYLANDYYACVAAGGKIEDGFLYWGSITDCRLIVFDQMGQIKLHAPDGMESFLEYSKQDPEEWSDPQRRRLVRSQYRNNPRQVANGKCVSYGALTGEKEAEYFMQFGQEKLDKGDLIVFYSDGFEGLVGEEDFFKASYHENEELAKKKIMELDSYWSKNDYEKYGRERTLIAHIY